MSRYQISVLGLYALITPFIFFFYPEIFVYSGSFADAAYLSTLFVVALTTFLVVNYFINCWEIGYKIQSPKNVLHATLGAVAFSIPEEIIFRGLIITLFAPLFSSTLGAVIVSSIIFGVAHLPNGARGFSPREWNWKFAVMAGLGGIFLGLAYVHTNTLLAPTLFHFFFLLLLLLFLKQESAVKI